MKTHLLIFGTFLLLVACDQTNRDLESYGDIAAGSGGITLINPAEHMGGYGRGACLMCHNAALNLHRGPNSLINVDALNQQIRDNGGDAYCLVRCHGPNGT
ncbi:MAG: hypothetical protein A3F16_04455 [Deltaproteobacteria bacterium RIFCSPHIGHO2_12_FULL_43_9]|nr:MAG: hypothetical protein A3F16_04455 [Deltaproteobacteria bacterium RIFCSPHIGHO2_12_FULL_43_9]